MTGRGPSLNAGDIRALSSAGERSLHTGEVVGSIPTAPTIVRRPKKKTATKLRSWRVVTMRSRGELLGYVEALDRERAEAVAIKQFDLDQDQRRRPLIRERQG